MAGVVFDLEESYSPGGEIFTWNSSRCPQTGSIPLHLWQTFFAEKCWELHTFLRMLGGALPVARHEVRRTQRLRAAQRLRLQRRLHLRGAQPLRVRRVGLLRRGRAGRGPRAAGEDEPPATVAGVRWPKRRLGALLKAWGEPWVSVRPWIIGVGFGGNEAIAGPERTSDLP